MRQEHAKVRTLLDGLCLLGLPLRLHRVEAAFFWHIRGSTIRYLWFIRSDGCLERNRGVIVDFDVVGYLGKANE